MNIDFQAYYNTKATKIFLIISIICFVLAIADIIFLGGIMAAGLILCGVVLIFIFLLFRKKKGVAVEVVDDVLKFYYHELIEIPLADILFCKVNTSHGSFDVIVQTKTDEYGIHCLIQDQWNKKREFIELMERKGVSVKKMSGMPSL